MIKTVPPSSPHSRDFKMVKTATVFSVFWQLNSTMGKYNECREDIVVLVHFMFKHQVLFVYDNICSPIIYAAIFADLVLSTNIKSLERLQNYSSKKGAI